MDAAEEAVLPEDQHRRLRNQQIIAEGAALAAGRWPRIALASVHRGQQHQARTQECPAGSRRLPAGAAGTAE